MKIVKITNGEVHLKDIYSRKLQKQVNAVLFKKVDMKMDQSGKQELAADSSFSVLDEASDIAVVGMTEKIIINGEEKPVSVATYDDLPMSDYETVKKAVDEVTGRELPKV